MDEKAYFYWSKSKLGPKNSAFGKWELFFIATEKGLCVADIWEGSEHKMVHKIRDWVARHCPNGELVRCDERLQPYMAQYAEYRSGKRSMFTFALDLRGTPFQLAVWRALLSVPYGQTATYSDMAADIGKPRAVRAVGAAIGANPILIAVPCHRVIGKNNKLTGFRAGLDMKRTLLEFERQKQASHVSHYH